MELNVGVVGATGMVGEVFMQILEERQFPIAELRPFASEKSLGKSLKLGKREFPIQVLKEGCFDGLDLVFFSSGDPISKEWAPKAAAAGAFAVDNSAAFRMSPDHILCVPEINGGKLPPKDQPTVIANPNCSTIQLVLALKPLADQFGLEDVRVATYQAVSGGGKPAEKELLDQSGQYLKGEDECAPQAFPHKIAFNCIPQIGSFNDEGFCSEEAKIMRETQKILDLPELKVSAFTVRVPAMNSHAEVAWVTLKKDTTQKEMIEALNQMSGISVMQDSSNPEIYPLQRNVSGEEDVFVGRIHKDPAHDRTWILWIVGDNILKGAALNGLQIAERIFDISRGS